MSNSQSNIEEFENHIATLKGYDKLVAEATMISAMNVYTRLETKRNNININTNTKDGVWLVVIKDEVSLMFLVEDYRRSIRDGCPFTSKLEMMYLIAVKKEDEFGEYASRLMMSSSSPTFNLILCHPRGRSSATGLFKNSERFWGGSAVRWNINSSDSISNERFFELLRYV